MNIATVVFCVAIVLIAYYYYRPLRRLSSFVGKWNGCNKVTDIESSYTGMKEIDDDYFGTLVDMEDKKTTSHAEDFYYRSNIARAIKVNLKAISSAPGLISGLGVLGTFLGLTISVYSFNASNSEEIMKSIQTLLGGMGMAFLTSVIGMILSSFYIWRQKKVYNDLDISSARWCKKLDDLYYISEIELLRRENFRQQNAMMERLNVINETNEKQHKLYVEGLANLKMQGEELQNNLMKAIVSYDENGDAVNPGDMLQNLYEEAEKQSQALESFTTDLSNELNASLGKTMDMSIVPLIQDLRTSHQALNKKLETLATNIQSPASDMVTSVVGELKTSMQQITAEFKDNILSGTVNQMETLAANLTKTGEVLNNIPQTMTLMSQNLSDSFSNVKGIVTQLQTSVESQQSQMVEKAKTVNEEMATQMKDKFDEIMSMISVTVSKLNDQQGSLIEGQGRSAKEIERLLASFNESISRMKQSNSETLNTLVNVQKVGEKLDESASRINEMSSVMKDVSNSLIQQQNDSMEKYKEVQENNQETIDNIKKTLNTTQELLKEYSQQYDIIHSGLKDIFAEITKGLQDYSTTLSKSTGEALGVYSEALDKSTKGLQNIAEALNESAEELTDSVDKLKRLR